MKRPADFTIRFHITLMLCMGLVVLLMTLVTVIIALQAGSRASRESAEVLFDRSTDLVQEKLDHLLGDLIGIADVGAALPMPGGNLAASGDSNPIRPYLETLIRVHPNLYSLYFGYPNGDFYQIINAAGSIGIIRAQKAPANTVTIVRTISGQGQARQQTWQFFDAAHRSLGKRTEAKPEYDHRTREWYTGACRSTGTYLSSPYVFSSLQAPGLTAAHQSGTSGIVFGADLTLTGLQDFVLNQTVSANSFLLVYDPSGRLMALSRGAAKSLGEEPKLMELPGPRAKSLLAAARISKQNLPPELARLFCTVTTWSLGSTGNLVIMIAAPREDFNGPFNEMRFNFLMMSLISLVIILPLTLLLTRRLSSMLVTMAGDAERISRFDFSSGNPGRSVIREFNQLSDGFSLMKATIASRSEALANTMEALQETVEKQRITSDKLTTLVDLGTKMSSLKDTAELCQNILEGAMDLTHAEGGTLYLRGTGDLRDKLEFVIVRNRKLPNLDQGGPVNSGKPKVTLPAIALYDADGTPNSHHAVSDAFHKDATINIADAYNYQGHDLSGTRNFDKIIGYHTESILTVPLKPLGRTVMGALQLINAHDQDWESGTIRPFNQEIESLVKALAAQAATALYNQKLIHDLEQLFESMISVIVEAIDAKSPYTGGHNKRVPIIAKMLAEVASRSTEGPLAGWTVDKNNGVQQFHIAAMLHDCGKITTPEYVVDKATKLETIYNRIHEVRTRFEVLLRDVTIEHRDRLLAGAGRAEADAWLSDRILELQADFAFLAESNLGGEFMAPDRVERLKTIAARRWVRHFDDTLGLSKEELDLVPAEARVPPPVEETLLADKVRHRIPRVAGTLERYARHNFKIDIPELKYNRGEIYNLAISRGTLTTEERFKINEHIMQTIDMLSNLCENSEGLPNVVEWAGSHHETLKGTGYPRKLSAQDLAVEARIMSIADIFEALTASDRPYKPAKTLSEAIKILFNFKKEGHIDPDLFDLFLSSGVYRQYGEKYLAPGQVDEVDISLYVGKMA